VAQDGEAGVIDPGGLAVGTATAASTLRLLVASSRPFSWINTALPYAAGALLVDLRLSPSLLLGMAYFLLPYNLLMYGVNDLFDYASDAANPRKGSIEGARLEPGTGRVLWLAVALTNLPLLAAMFVVGGSAAGLCCLLAAAAALVYSAPPLRTKERPFLDSLTSASHFALPAACGMLAAGLAPSALPWVPLAGFMAWGVASHALGAIQDIAYDRAAGIGSIATAIGARSTAAVSVVGYALAAAAAATLGPAGWAAAAILAPYLLLPLSVLARPGERQARRAWRSFLGMNLLAGFLLTQLLLRYWGVMTYSAVELVVSVALAGAVVILANIVLNAAALRRRAAAVDDAEAPSLTVVLPCRNEHDRLLAELEAVRRQDYPRIRIIVVNDDSTDGTLELAARLLPDRSPDLPPHSVVPVPPRPEGWTGKCWAGWQGAAATTDDLVLFVDSDTLLEPLAARALVSELVGGGYDLVSGVTRLAVPSRAERVLGPGFTMLLFGLIPLWLLALLRGRPAALAFAYGPLMLVRRAAYVAVGGHAAISGTERDDVALARLFVRAGRSVGTVHAADLGATRHYRSAGEIAAAWRRLFYPSVGYSLAAGLATLGVFAIAWLLPAVVALAIGVAAATGSTAWTAHLPAALVSFGLLAVARTVLAIRGREPFESILWTPLTAAATLVMQARGLVGGLLGAPGPRSTADQPMEEST
jgi:4-hydroxybenzoate polyprenyltransferase